MIAVSLVLTLIGAALFVVSLFRSDDLNIVLLCIGCALLAAVFLGVGALRSRPSRKPVLASGAQDRAAPGDARAAAPQPAGATALTVLERDDEPPGWAPPKSGTTAALPGPTQPADDTGWRRPQTSPTPARPVATIEDEFPEDGFAQDAALALESLEEPEPEPEAPAPPRPAAARRPAAQQTAKQAAKPAGATPAKSARASTAKPRATAAATTTRAGSRKAATTRTPAAPAAVKATTPAKAAKTTKASPPARASRAVKTAPAKSAKAATPAVAKSTPPARKTQAQPVDASPSARDLARVEEVLGPVSGLGPAKRAQLLRFFGTWRRLRNASVERLAQVPGITPPLAERIRAALDE